MRSKYRHPEDTKLFCCYCGRWIVYPLAPTIEHLIPLSMGGNNSNENKRDCCYTCNQHRGNMPLEEFLEQSIYEAGRRSSPNIYEKRIENIKELLHYVDNNKHLLITNG